MAQNNKNITTLNQLQKLIPRLLHEVNSDQSLMRAAAANPILALEHLGFTLTPSVKKEIENRILADKTTQKKLDDLQKQVDKIAGKKLNLSSNTSITNFLQKELGENVQCDDKSSDFESLKKALESNVERVSDFFEKENKYDPLTSFKNTHKLIPLLIEYRTIKASELKLATKKSFNDLLKMNNEDENLGIRFSKLTFRLQDREQRKQNL